jgi:alanine racemase
MKYTIGYINELVNGRLFADNAADTISYLATDSRKLIFPETSLYFAFESPRRDGHDFVEELYGRGVKNFVLKRLPAGYKSILPQANIIIVDDTLEALQALVAAHRRLFTIPIVGITGSNGKTVVKEWLNQLLAKYYRIVRSPRSYNSQIGVPLSVWAMNDTHQLGVFEAGISKAGEMEKLEQIIQPTIGIFTNIGEAHNEGFLSIEQKIIEKLRLFKNIEVLIYHNDDDELHNVISEWLKENPVKTFSWGRKETSDLKISEISKTATGTTVIANYGQRNVSIDIPFSDKASVENAVHCWSVLLHLSVPEEEIERSMAALNAVEMRLEMKTGINNCSVINDSYSSDLSSLRIALDFLSQQKQHAKKTVILSDILQSGRDIHSLYHEVASLIQQYNADKFIGIGHDLVACKSAFDSNSSLETHFYASVEDFKTAFNQLSFHDETILIKGARIFNFETIDNLLQLHVHQTILEIDLNAVVDNLNEYRKILPPAVKIMAMVKAFSYGSGSFEIANVLQFHKVDYLAVAYADEGLALRDGGITLPIMVMNPDPAAFEVMVQNNLEPDLYSIEILESFEAFLTRQGLADFPVHIELETGMNRLGFPESQLPSLQKKLTTGLFRVQSIFSHLAASEDPAFDDFTMEQFTRFNQMCEKLEKELGYTPIKHIANSAGTSRHAGILMDMVRLGIGLYGADEGMKKIGRLREVSTLTTTVAQVKELDPAETVGYGRKGKLNRNSRIATVRIGYADGYPRNLGDGIGKMLIRGHHAPVVGTVCMDMTMVDVTDIRGVVPGDEVIVFGAGLPVMEIASLAETIPYEILTGISQRVKRVYFEE